MKMKVTILWIPDHIYTATNQIELFFCLLSSIQLLPEQFQVGTNDFLCCQLDLPPELRPLCRSSWSPLPPPSQIKTSIGNKDDARSTVTKREQGKKEVWEDDERKVWLVVDAMEREREHRIWCLLKRESRAQSNLFIVHDSKFRYFTQTLYCTWLQKAQKDKAKPWIANTVLKRKLKP